MSRDQYGVPDRAVTHLEYVLELKRVRMYLDLNKMYVTIVKKMQVGGEKDNFLRPACTEMLIQLIQQQFASFIN